MKKKKKTLSGFSDPIYPLGNIVGKTISNPTQSTWYGTLNYMTGATDDPQIVVKEDGTRDGGPGMAGNTDES
jgi:hypothetical protein